MFEKKLIISKNYIKSDVLLNTTAQIYGFGGHAGRYHRLSEYPEEIELGSKNTAKPTRLEIEKGVRSVGYCIRTGAPIPFNPSRPFCDSGYKSWAEFCNMNYPESFCHKTGKPSYGKTSMRRPIL